MFITVNVLSRGALRLSTDRIVWIQRTDEDFVRVGLDTGESWLTYAPYAPFILDALEK